MSQHTGSETLLGTYLKDRRAKLDPTAFEPGFAPYSGRRTPKRGCVESWEVAQRAGTSAPLGIRGSWQGRGGAPSAANVLSTGLRGP